MATTCAAGPDKVSVACSYQLVRAAGNIIDSLGVTYSGSTLSNGIAAGQADTEYKLLTTAIAAGGTLSLNLQSLTDQFGNALSFARIKRLFVNLQTTTTSSSIRLGRSGVANPSAAPALASAAGTMGDGAYVVAYSWLNALGETLISPTATITLAGGNNKQITVTPPALPSGVTGYNVYCSLVVTALALAKQNSGAQSGATYSITAVPTTTNAAPLQTNTTLNGVSTIFGTAYDSLIINNGCCEYLGTDPGAAGYAVTTNNKYLLITNLDGANIATIDLVVTGCSA